MTDHYGRHEIEARQAEEKRNPPPKKEGPAPEQIAAYVKRTQRDLDRFVAKLPKMVVTLREFKELGEYSTSYPTGTTPGKRWRAELSCMDFFFQKHGGKTRWIIRQYDPAAKPFDKDDKSTHQIAIHQYRPVIRVKAGSQKANA